MIFNPEDADTSFDSAADFEVGEADFTVKSANVHTSPEGKESIKVVSEAIDKNGTRKLIDTYLSKNAIFRVREFCYATDMKELFKSGELKPEDCIGKSGKCVTQLQKGTEFNDKKTNEKRMGYDKIVMKYFVSAVENQDERKDENFKEDDIPF